MQCQHKVYFLFWSDWIRITSSCDSFRRRISLYHPAPLQFASVDCIWQDAHCGMVLLSWSVWIAITFDVTVFSYYMQYDKNISNFTSYCIWPTSGIIYGWWTHVYILSCIYNNYIIIINNNSFQVYKLLNTLVN